MKFTSSTISAAVNFTTATKGEEDDSRREHTRYCGRRLSPGPWDARIKVVLFEPELIASAIELYRTRSDKNWSLTDCMSFVVMKRGQVTEALTTDRHFEQAGLKALMLASPVL